MKTSTLPSLRVQPELRDAVESVLADGETISSFIETSVRETIERRRSRTEFIERGLQALTDAQRTGIYYAAEQVVNELSQMLEKRKIQLRQVRG
jgi:predicted transcriptional regulator